MSPSLSEPYILNFLHKAKLFKEKHAEIGKLKMKAYIRGIDKLIIGRLIEVIIGYGSLIIHINALKRQIEKNGGRASTYIFLPLLLNISNPLNLVLHRRINKTGIKTQPKNTEIIYSKFPKYEPSFITKLLAAKISKLFILSKLKNLAFIGFSTLTKITKLISLTLSQNKARTKYFLATYMISSMCFLSSSANMQSKLIHEITHIEKKYEIPNGLLLSIAKIESALNPYAVNVEGKSYHFRSREEAISFTQELVSRGKVNFDVGVMQVNWRWHGNVFASLEEAFMIETNISYAGKLLKSLYEKYGSWHNAVRMYHSSRPEFHRIYSRKILRAWLNI